MRATNAPGLLDMTLNLTGEDLVRVRRLMTDFLDGWGVGRAAAESIITAVNELLTNVVVHTKPNENGDRRAGLSLQRVPGGVTALVTDDDPRGPGPVAPNRCAESGRGWMLVQALTNEASVTMSKAGKSIYLYVEDPDTSPADPGPTIKGAV